MALDSADLIDRILRSSLTIAVVGLSPNPLRPSHGVARYLLQAGYRVIPVNPQVEEVLGLKCYKTLREIAEPVDLVDIFRRSELVAPIVDDAIAIRARAIWMQDGVVDQASAERARHAGIEVVMDDCIMRQHSSRIR